MESIHPECESVPFACLLGVRGGGSHKLGLLELHFRHRISKRGDLTLHGARYERASDQESGTRDSWQRGEGGGEQESISYFVALASTFNFDSNKMPTVNLDRTEFFARLGKEYGPCSPSPPLPQLLTPFQFCSIQRIR